MSVETAFTEVLGVGSSFWMLLAGLLAAAWLAPQASVLRRYAALALLGLSLVRISPAATSWVLESVLPSFQPWRLLLWPIPAAALAAGGVLTLLACTSSARARGFLTGAVLLVLAAAAFWGPTSTLRSENHVRMGRPGLKVPPAEFELARRISAATSGRSIVLAPDAVATWIPVTRGHDYPYLNRLFWANRLGSRLGWRESQKRWKLMQYVDGSERYQMAPAALAQVLRDHEIDVVVFHRGLTWTDEIRGIAQDAGCRRILMSDRYEVWRQPVAP
jgi:hypothetical protein